MTSALENQPARTPARSAARLGGAALLLALVAAAMWFAWLGWDTEHDVVDGEQQGPYQAWQVIGCGLSVAVASVLALLWVRSSGWAGAATVLVLSAAALAGFAVPWTVHAAATDDSGLWAVGLMFLVVGGGAALTVLLGVTAALTRGRRRAGTPRAAR